MLYLILMILDLLIVTGIALWTFDSARAHRSKHRAGSIFDHLTRQEVRP
jgi:hypothetical protein